MPILALTIVYFLSRLLNLTLLPVFTDEANYLDWGWRMTHMPEHWFYSLYDAKQPLLMWFFGWAQNIFGDPLFAGRIVSVFTGLLILFGVYTLTKYLTNSKTAVLASVVYIAIPLFALFDRQALMESALGAIGIWSLYLLTRYLQENKPWQLLTLSTVLGLGFSIKSSALLFIVTTIGILIFKLRSNVILPLVTLLITISVVCAPLFMQPKFWSTWELNSRYQMGLAQLVHFPLSQWWANYTAIADVLLWQLTPLLYLAIMWGVFKKHRSYLLLITWTFIPLVLQGATATFIVSRYTVSFLVPLVVLLAVSVNWKYLLAALSIPLFLTTLQLFSPVEYFRLLSQVTKYSYVEAYVDHEASGYMTSYALPVIKQLANQEPIMLGLALFSGNPEVGLLINLRNNPNVTTAYFDAQLLGTEFIDKYDCLKFPKPVYLASRSNDQAGLNKYFDEYQVLTNPYSDSKIYLSKLKTNCQGTSIDLTLLQQ